MNFVDCSDWQVTNSSDQFCYRKRYTHQSQACGLPQITKKLANFIAGGIFLFAERCLCKTDFMVTVVRRYLSINSDASKTILTDLKNSIRLLSLGNPSIADQTQSLESSDNRPNFVCLTSGLAVEPNPKPNSNPNPLQMFSTRLYPVIEFPSPF